MMRQSNVRWCVWGLVWAIGCGASPAPKDATRAEAPGAEALPAEVTITVLGTNDLHGHAMEASYFAGFVDRLREVRRGNGAVLIFDGGDLFQGTLESNLAEGKAIIAAYNAIGYTASTIGNHEFDYGPVGPATTPRTPADDPRGALKARLAEARFPFVSANLVSKVTGHAFDWPNLEPSTTVNAAGVRVGVVGLATADTPRTTLATNVTDLAVGDAVEATRREAERMRASGATLVLGVGHMGGKCGENDVADDISSCAPGEEAFRLLDALPPGTLDGFIGGHTHQFVAHNVAGVPMIESGAMGRAFGRIDFRVERATGRILERRVFPPQLICLPDSDPCEPGEYEGATIVPNASVRAAIAPYLDAAEVKQHEPLGVMVEGTFGQAGDRETALGNLLADLILTARPRADLAVMNGGGIRAPLPEGPLTYGRFFQVFPFDNRFATLEVSGAELEALVLHDLRSGHGIASFAGVSV
ncbi:MAG: bifunctional metallophosphatase/5'-nucleotidase, partial [Myxococcales bacterium]|nr:bifunctional metallophosphatase/5'-nucleotidase [Myxococcales bacterium]